MRIRRVVPNIQSIRMDESNTFYTEFLGMEVAMDMDWIVTFVASDNPTAQISIMQTEKGTEPVADMSLTVEVADVDAAHARAEELRVEIVYPLTDEPWHVRWFHVADPNGVVVNLISHA